MLTFFQSDDAPIVRKPFVEDYVLKEPTCIGKPFSVLEVFLTKKRNGYMVITQEFNVFLFADAKITGLLLEALNAYITTQQGYELFIVPAENSPFYALACDFEKPATWLLTKGKYTWLQDATVGLEKSQANPFLPPHTQKATNRKKPSGVSLLSQSPSSGV